MNADASHVQTESEVSAGATTSTTRNTRTEERLILRHSAAHILDPRLLTFSLGGTFGLAQEQTKVDTGVSESVQERDADLSGYDVFVGILPGNDTFASNIFANRNRYIQAREFAGSTDIDTENAGITLMARRLYIPSTLTFSQFKSDQFSRTGNFTSRTDETRDVVTYDGRRGWINTELNIHAEHIEKTDLVRPELDFQSDTLSIRSSMDFGTELNRRWDSRIRWFEREDSSEEERLDVDERIELRHSDSLKTSYRYNLLSTQRPTGETESHIGTFTLHHQLQASLTTRLQLDAFDQSLTSGERDIYRGRADIAYTKILPADGRLNAGLGLTYEWERDDFTEAETIVLQESHSFATPFALPITLNNPFVIADSVVIEKSAEGPTPPGCIPAPQVPIVLLEGIDYSLRVVGNLLEVVPVDCTLSASGVGINPGDTIIVDYRYATPTMQTFTTKGLRFDTSVDYGWIRPYFIYDRRYQDLVEGATDRFLDDRTTGTTGLQLRYTGVSGETSLLTEYTQFTSRDQDYDELRGNLTMHYDITTGTSLRMNAQRSHREFSFPEQRDTDTLAVRLSLTYRPDAQLFTEVFLIRRELEDTLVSDETRNEGGGRAIWQLGKLRIEPSFRFIEVERRDGDFRSETRESRGMLNITRRF